MLVIDIAKVAHELNKAYCESLGDNSQPSWEDAPEWQKSSAINGVQFHLDNPAASPSASHDSWMKQKTEEGWSYGEVKNPDLKQHPCFVPYDQLPAEQKAKDYIFRQAIHSLKLFLYHPKTSMSESGLQNNHALSFGEAIMAARQGKKVQRAGWNGANMYAYIVPANSYPAQTDVAKAEFGDMVPYREYWALKTAQGDVATWAPSGSDSLASDWVILD